MVTRGKALYKRGRLRVLITIACTSSSKASLSKQAAEELGRGEVAPVCGISTFH
jgi:hypothetical protein